jgi:hypothetical protein
MLEPVFPASDEDQPRTCFGTSNGTSTTDAAGGAGDEDGNVG